MLDSEVPRGYTQRLPRPPAKEGNVHHTLASGVNQSHQKPTVFPGFEERVRVAAVHGKQIGQKRLILEPGINEGRELNRLIVMSKRAGKREKALLFYGGIRKTFKL